MLNLKTVICFLFIFIKFGQTYRLPTSLIPEKYNLKIITYLDEGDEKDFTFVGRVKIQVKCVEPTKTITLNTKELHIYPFKTTVKCIHNDNELEVENEMEDEVNEFYIINLKRRLNSSYDYEIKIDYKGNLTDGLMGYYRSSYNNPLTNKKHWLGTTQFEPTAARKAFPCFDEPSYKAKFTITLGHHKRFSAISNMPLMRSEDMPDKKDWVWDFFQESVTMSTYLVAFVVSDFGYQQSPDALSSTIFRIWARKNALNQTKFAEHVGPNSLTFYENYFGIKYPLPKQDMIAIPDFSSGAMENWGLVTYRDTALLFDENVGTLKNKVRVASVVCHELAHQWFGNLVTMKWWTDLWLNEGFATYMASLCVHNLFPKWKSLETEIITDLLRVYSLDSLTASHPVSVPIKNPSEIVEIFDTISYRKGSFILHMMDLFLGENVLRKGVSNYLKAHAYSNAEQDDLWSALTKQAHYEQSLNPNITVKVIMDTWTLQTGYPILTIERNYDDGTVTITQERYYSSGRKFSNHREHRDDQQEPCWWVPLTYTTEEEQDFSSTKPKSWLRCPKESLTLTIPNSQSWLIFNVQASGLYIVNYDSTNWNMLIKQLKTNIQHIEKLNRVILIHNAMELAESGYLDYEIAFSLLSFVKHEVEYLPWKTALDKLSKISTRLLTTPNYGLIKKYKRNLVSPMYEKLGGLEITDEKRNSLNEVNYQLNIAHAACYSGFHKCLNDVQDMFEMWLRDPDSAKIGQDVKSLVYCRGIQKGDEEEWDILWKKYKTSNVASEKTTILSALACTEKVWLLARYLNYAFGGDPSIRSQDSFSVFVSVATNPVGYPIAKSFFQDNLQRIYNWIGSKKGRLGQYIKIIASEVVSERQQKEFTQFIEENHNLLKDSQYAVQQALEKMELNVNWHKKYYKIIENILSKDE